MIPIFLADGTRSPMTYNGFTLNSMSTVESNPVGTRVEAVAPSGAIDYITDKLQWRDGIELYGVTKGSRVLVLNGFVHGSSRGDLWDRVTALCHAFDPGWIQFANSDPFLPFDFTVPTASSTIPSRMYLMPLSVPEPIEANVQGYARRFQLTMLARDPRRYRQATEARQGSGVLTHVGDYPSHATIAFTMSGAGSSSFTAASTGAVQGTRSLVLDLSGLSNGNAVSVDLNRQSTFVNGTRTDSLFKSGDWWAVEPGTNTLAFTNTTNVGTITTTFRPAYGA